MNEESETDAWGRPLEGTASTDRWIEQYLHGGSMSRSDAKDLLFARMYGGSTEKIEQILSVDPGNTAADIAYVQHNPVTPLPSESKSQAVIDNLNKKLTRLKHSAVEAAHTIRQLNEQLEAARKANDKLTDVNAELIAEKGISDDERFMLASLREQIQLHEDDNQQLVEENNRLRAQLREAGL